MVREVRSIFNLRVPGGERGERRRGREERPERVAAVYIFKAASTAAENIGHRNRTEVRVLLPQPKKTPPIRVVFSLVMAGVKPLPQVMRPTGVARWVASLRAASGRGSAGAASAAVEKIEGKRKPDDFFGHRKRDSPKLPKTEKQVHTRHRNRAEVRVLLPQPTLRTEKDIGSQTPETTTVSGFFRAFFQGGIQKISFPKNDLWGGLKLNSKDIKGRFCDSFRKVCLFCFYKC